MSKDAPWKQAIADAYRIFSVYPAPRDLHAAEKHNVAEVLARLRAAPLNVLPADKLGAFAGSALYAIGDLADYKHFLPRILDLSMSDHGWVGLDPQAIAGKLVYARWRDWPQAEQDVIEKVFNLAWRMSRDNDPDEHDAPDWLCALAYLHDDINEALSDWLPLRNAYAALQLARLVTRLHGELPWWDDAPALPTVSAWVLSPAVRQALADAPVPSDEVWQITEALKYLIRH